MRLKLALLIPGILFACVTRAAAPDPALLAARQNFLLAEQYAEQNRDAEFAQAAAGLKDYPLYPYLQYQWLKKHLDDTAGVQTFLQDYPNSRYSQLLRQKWLADLAKREQWLDFLRYYRSSRDQDLQCYAALAQYRAGLIETALQNALQFWLSGKTLPPECDPLLTLLQQSSGFSPEWVWKRFQTALQINNPQLAKTLTPLLPEARQSEAALWLKLHQQPETLKEAAPWKQEYPQAAALFQHALKRWLQTDINAALAEWEQEKSNFSLGPGEIADMEKQLALQLAFKHDSRAVQRLSQLSNPDETSREWRVRAALLQTDWKQTDAALAALTAEQQQQDKWRYWRAKTDAALNGAEAAAPQFQTLARNRGYYGLLAGALLNQTLPLNHRPLQIADADLARLAEMQEFKVAAELLAIGRPAEARLQWWFAVNPLKQQELTVAAKLADQLHCPSLAILTLARANEWDDVNLRFPILYQDPVTEAAASGAIDPALIFGLIRQESAFDELAESPAGARGLMQLMPQTAQQIAAERKEAWRGGDSLFDPLLNIRYGAYYYRTLYQQFNRHPALAAAAYNAGPARVKRWRAETGPQPADIWLENIPFKETRNYVTSVLLYTVIYQQRLQRDTLNPRDLLKPVTPD